MEGDGRGHVDCRKVVSLDRAQVQSTLSQVWTKGHAAQEVVVYWVRRLRRVLLLVSMLRRHVLH